MADHQPPASFEENLKVPEAGYRTAIAITHEGRMTDVRVTFMLRQHGSGSATYAATCPRCNTGEIVVTVALDGDGRFAQPPACPALCLACEDALDAMLEPKAAADITSEPGDRATLGKYLNAMNVRAWER